MNGINTLKIYEKVIKGGKESYRYFFIKKDFQPLFDNLGEFTLICSDGTQYANLEVCISGNVQKRYFIFVNDFFIEHPKLGKDEEIEFNIDRKKRAVFLHIQVSPSKNELITVEIDHHPQLDIKVLEQTIQNIKDCFKKHEWYFRVYEANVRAELVDPILKTIGWTPPFIHREEERMDYLLYGGDYFNKESPKIVIEVKKFREQLRTTGGCRTAINNENEQQLIKYCKRDNIQATVGLLTNGIRWCLYLKDSNNEYHYNGEINIEHSPMNNLYKFFYLISRLKFDKTNQFDWKWLENTKRDERRPRKISINSEPYECQKKAVCKVAKMFVDKCHENINDPYSYCFSDTIITNKGNHNSVCYDIHGKKYYINSYRGIYEQIILLQEINSRFDLGLTIKSY